MKKILLCMMMLLVVGCQKQETKPQKSNWYMLVKSTKDDSQYTPFLNESFFSDTLLNKIKDTKGVEDVEPVYIFDTTLVEPGKLDTFYGNVKIYKNNEFIDEYFYNTMDTSVKNFHFINIFGYPEDSNIEQFTEVQSKTENTEGCYLSQQVAQQLGINNLDDDYELEIYCLIPVSNRIEESMFDEYPDLVQDVTNDKQVLYPYTLKIKVAGILDSEISSSRGQLYIPLKQMQKLINEHQIEEVRTNNYIVKVKDSSVLEAIQSLDKGLKIYVYPLESEE